MTQYPRALLPTLQTDLEIYPVVLLMGARQVGKTTLAREIAQKRGFGYATLDDSGVRRQAIDDPEGLVASLGDNGGVIDEVQRAPEVLLAIKAVVDRDNRPGRYLLTGSNQPAIGRAVGDSLLGRAAYRTLRPLTMSELRLADAHAGWSFLFSHDNKSTLTELSRRADTSGALDWREVAATGGFPRAVAAPPTHRAWQLDDYVTAFVRRDVPALLGINDVERFETFFRLIAAQTGQELNASRLSSDLGANVKTITRWLHTLERSYMIELLPSYSRNSGSRAIKKPKLFIVDVALALVAARETTATGFHFENLVVSDAAVWRDGAPGRAWYHWRIGTGQEVDLVLEENQRLLPVEMKVTSNVTFSDARHIRSFIERHPNAAHGVVISNDPDIRMLANDIIAAPWWSVL